MKKTMDARDLGPTLTLPGLGQYQGPPALRHPLVALLSSRAVSAARGMEMPAKADWVARK